MADDMKDAPPGVEGASQQHKAFVGGLSFQMNNQDLKDAFARFDSIDAEVMIDRHTGRPRGFGFVYFKDDQGLKDAIDGMHDKELEGRRISVVKAVPQDQTKPGTPAAQLGAGAGARRDSYPRRDYGPPRGGGYDRGGYGAYDRGYDRGGYDRYGYDPRYAGYERGYDSRGYGGYGYDRPDPYRDAYARSGYGGYGGYGYDDRSGGYGSSYGYDRAYDDRGAGGPERRGYSASTRAAPYDRPAERRPAEAPPRR